MYCLLKYVIIAQTALKYHILPFGYAPAPITPGLWNKNKKYFILTLVVDEFGTKYRIKQDTYPLINAHIEKN